MESGFWDENSDLVSAIVTIAGAILIALIVDRVVIARGKLVAKRVADTPVSRTAQTRLRLVRRLIFLFIVLIGVAIALRNVTGAKNLATGILASSAVLGIVVGFAARQSVANAVAGVMLAVAQPIRIGDRVTVAHPEVGEVSGRVDDITLSYTYVDPGDGRLLVVPNDLVVSHPIFNHSTGNLAAPVKTSVWLPPDGDVGGARRALDEVAEIVQVAEVTPDGVRLELTHRLDGERTRVGGEEAALRERAQGALREAGLLSAGERSERTSEARPV